MTPNEPRAVPERYLADRFDWAAPGDQQEDAWLVRFCDKDCGEAIFTGPDAEREAWEYWNRYAPSYSLYVFRLAALKRPSAAPSEVEREGFAPCPTCRQWSHSLGTDQVAEALMHFEMMIAHPVRGHPMGRVFDERTREMAQVLIAAARSTDVPAGMVLVPREPTEAMQQAGGKAEVHKDSDETEDQFVARYASEAWSAMIAAAPSVGGEG